MRPKTPELTVDIIIELSDRSGSPIVLIERKYPPPGWALPGGFVDVGETVENAARREAFEETCLRVELDCLLGCYSDPARDPRGHTVGLVYIAQARGEPVAADDAARVAVYGVDQLAVGQFDLTLAFDHDQIIADYLRYRASGVIPKLV